MMQKKRKNNCKEILGNPFANGSFGTLSRARMKKCFWGVLTAVRQREREREREGERERERVAKYLELPNNSIIFCRKISRFPVLHLFLYCIK